MTEWLRFPNAPITEALLDIRVRLPAAIDLQRLATFQATVQDRYPQRRERSSWQGGVEIKAGGLAVVRQSGGLDGYLFTSADGRQIVQARLDGFTFNRLKPYDKWETFRDEARQLWERYLKVATPELVSRVALRYINRLNLPLPLKDFKEYIFTTPEIAPNLPQGLSSFFMRLVIPQEKSKSIVIITETMEPPGESRLPLIFDIDVFREATFDPAGQEIWEVMEQLRELKNEIFFSSTTAKAKELFK